MSNQFVKFFLLIATVLVTYTDAFWWPKPTTETPTPLLKQIPLTYFRTYTYQPLAGNPFGFPFFGFGAAQTPLLTNARFDTYPTALPLDGASLTNAEVLPTTSISSVAAPPSTQRSTTSSTTSTTTTPPPPTTTTTTSTSTMTTTTTGAPLSSTKALPAVPYHNEYPTYSRRVYAGGYNSFVRPQYPYPDYFNYQPVTSNSIGLGSLKTPAFLSSGAGGAGSRIQFVPCMCPISIALAGNAIGASASGVIVSSGAGGGEPLQARNGELEHDTDVVDKFETEYDAAAAEEDVAAKFKIASNNDGRTEASRVSAEQTLDYVVSSSARIMRDESDEQQPEQSQPVEEIGTALE